MSEMASLSDLPSVPSEQLGLNDLPIQTDEVESEVKENTNPSATDETAREDTQCSASIIECTIFKTLVPEKEEVHWEIEDFLSFREAALVGDTPPLVSPEIAGCHIRLFLADGQIKALIKIPPSKWKRDGLLKVDVDIMATKHTVLQTCKSLDIKIRRNRETKIYPIWILKHKCWKKTDPFKLLVNGSLTLRIRVQWFPHDGGAFRGFKAGVPLPQPSDAPSMFRDIQSFCEEDSSQNVQIRCATEVYSACKFLLAARARKLRPLLTSDELARFNCLSLKDVLPKTLEQMLLFVHTDSCDWLDDSDVAIEGLLDLFKVANRYEVDALIIRTTAVLTTRMDANNILLIQDAAETGSSEELKEAGRRFLDTIPGSQVAQMVKAHSSSDSQSVAI